MEREKMSKKFESTSKNCLQPFVEGDHGQSWERERERDMLIARSYSLVQKNQSKYLKEIKTQHKI